VGLYERRDPSNAHVFSDVYLPENLFELVLHAQAFVPNETWQKYLLIYGLDVAKRILVKWGRNIFET
jgi:hypothetical protein